jgi:hypothetical protein
MSSARWPGGDAEGGHLEGWAAWADYVRALLDMASMQAASMICVDEDFSHWPLGERACVASLEQWALVSKQTQCAMIARDWSEVARRHPRWVQWRTLWNHRVPCRVLLGEEQSSMQNPRPMLVLQGVMGLQLLDADRGTAVWSRRPSALAGWWHQCDAILQRSQEGMPVTTLGL